MTQRWRINLFGGLRAERGEKTITRFKSQKIGGLLAFLACHLRQSHTREFLIDLLWPDSTLEAGRNSLSVALSSLRYQFEPPGTPANSVIRADRFSVGLNAAAVTTDVAEFESAISAAAKSQSTTERLQYLSEAVATFQGPLLPAYYEEWVAPEQERLSGLFFDAVSALIQQLEQSGDTAGALSYARKAVGVDPHREEFHGDVMRLLAAMGHPAAALRQFHELARLLDEEIGDEPSAALRTLARRIESQTGLAPALPMASSHALHLPDTAAGRQALPDTVTFLMTGVAGSNRLRERGEDGFRAAMGVSHALLRREVARFGGQQIKDAGDSLVAVFGSARRALDCAVASQRALAGVEWPETLGDPLLVRMALHTGDVEYREARYDGHALRHTAGMLIAAHGGQILISEVTAGLVRRDLTEDVRLIDLGIFRLRDLPTPETLFQVVHSGMVFAQFPPPGAEAGFAAHLPLRFTRFFGREADIVQIVELLSPHPQPLSETERGDLSSPSHRLITLTGPGGAGKTRLALEVAERLVEPLAGAVYFTPMADLSDPRLIAEAIRDSLLLTRSAQREPLEQVVEGLAGRPSLLVLDNMEQLVEGGAQFVQALLARVPSLTVLVTSRRILGLSSERDFPVAPLSIPSGGETPERLSLFESVQLFVDRAQQVMPDFQVTNANAAAVAELCSRLEGIPLAIELAAARAVVLTPVQMLGQLAQRFGFLVSRKRDMSERHRTLRAAVDWSYRLLSPEVQRFFIRLSLFRGGWTAEAAEAVCEEPLALDLLAQLRECSMVLSGESETAIRFRMLETLREFAEEQLSVEERTLLLRRHAAFYLALAEQAAPELTGPEQAAWLAVLEVEHGNLRAALASASDDRSVLRLAGALWRFWSVRGYVHEGRLVLDAVLARLPDSDFEPGGDALKAAALDAAGALAHDQGDYAVAAVRHDESVALWRALGDKRGLALALNNRGNVALDLQDFDAAACCYEEALALYRAGGDPIGAAKVSTNLGALAFDRGDLDRAASLVEESIAIKRTMGNTYGLAMSLDLLGSVEKERGNIDRAAELYADGLALRRALEHKQGIAMSLTNLGTTQITRGEPDAAHAALQESLTLFEELSDQRGLAECLFAIARLNQARNRHEPAGRLFAAIAALRTTAGVSLSPSEQIVEQRALEAVRTALGEKPLTRASSAGRAMNLEQTLAAARTASAEA